MTARKNTEALMEGRQLRRMKEEDRFLARRERLEAKAEPMIGELVREGRTVFYAFPAGGSYRESTSHYDVVEFLIRNHYVR
jgi:hypothetical protein